MPARKGKKKNKGKGSSKRNRGAGNRGGRGRAGAGKKVSQKEFKFRKEGQTLEKRGFKSIKQKKGLHPETMNVGDLNNLLREKVKEEGLEDKDEVTLDLSEYDYDKLLGGGHLHNLKGKELKVKVSQFTDKAEEKLSDAGGQIEKID